MVRKALAATAALAVVCTLPAHASGAGSAGCEDLRPTPWAAATGAPDPAGDVRVYAIQYKQELRHVETYDSFRRKTECLIEDLVLPTADGDGDGTADGPTIVVFNEDAGLATLGTGSRGVPARLIAERGPKDPQNIPGAIGAFASLAATYAPAITHYAARHPGTSPQRLILSAATDGFVRGFMRTNSDAARTYGVYIVSSNNQAEFRETAGLAAVAALADPDLAASYATGALSTVYEAVDAGTCEAAEGDDGCDGIDVFNQAWMWAPEDAPDGHPVRTRYETINGGPLSAGDPRRNIIQVNKKTPLTSLEREILDLSDDGDMGAGNTGPFRLLDDAGLPCTDASAEARCAAKVGYGISLPAFKWGPAGNGGGFGDPFVGNPCASSSTWMRCLDARGINLFLQPEANPGTWAEYHDCGWSPCAFQALSWKDSAWRAVADPSVTSIRYAVTPHLVGNLVDLTFDGQSVIFERCLPRTGGDTCAGNASDAFVGTGYPVPCDPPAVTERCDDPDLIADYIGPHPETMAQAAWADPAFDRDTDREVLAERSRALQAGTGSPHENAYLETGVWADLDLDPPA